jgi:hypothetical protein
VATYGIKRTDEHGSVFVVRYEAESAQAALMAYLSDSITFASRMDASLEGIAHLNGRSWFVAPGGVRFEAVPVPER